MKVFCFRYERIFDKFEFLRREFNVAQKKIMTLYLIYLLIILNIIEFVLECQSDFDIVFLGLGLSGSKAQDF